MCTHIYQKYPIFFQASWANLRKCHIIWNEYVENPSLNHLHACLLFVRIDENKMRINRFFWMCMFYHCAWPVRGTPIHRIYEITRTLWCAQSEYLRYFIFFIQIRQWIRRPSVKLLLVLLKMHVLITKIHKWIPHYHSCKKNCIVVKMMALFTRPFLFEQVDIHICLRKEVNNGGNVRVICPEQAAILLLVIFKK